jgi:predicted Fe-S protein YdhL (DUF1289 family)
MIQSPCIDVCMIDPRTSLCGGCGRSLDEVAAWSTLSDAERATVMQALPARMHDAGLSVPVKTTNLAAG